MKRSTSSFPWNTLFLMYFVVVMMNQVSARTANVTFYWQGAGPVCASCDGGYYTPSFACSYGNRGSWNNGYRFFMDPTPPGSVIYGVDVVLHGAFDCDDFSPNAVVVITLQKEVIANQPLPSNLPCFCGNCVGNYSVGTSLSRDWPGYNHSGNNTFQISVQGPNAICLSSVDLTLSYFPSTPFVGSIFPMSGPTSGNTTVTVVGDSFANDTDWSCIFDKDKVVANYVSGSAISCNSPPHNNSGLVLFEVHDETDQTILTASLFHYYVPPILDGISPSSGPAGGGTVVTISGKGNVLFNTTEAGCFFGSTLGYSYYVDSNHFLCKSPGGSGTVPIYFSLNRQQYVFAGKFHYVDTRALVPPDYRYLIVGSAIFVFVLVSLIVWTIVRRRMNRKGYEAILDSKQNNISLDGIKIGPRIGKGNFGEVFKATWRGTDIALKKFPCHNLTDQLLRDFQREVTLMRSLRHPNVLQFLGSCMVFPDIFLCTEYMPRGSLYRILHDAEQALNWALIKSMCIDAAKGCLYLHTCEPMIVHRDLKSHNLLVDNHWKVKVCDFGLSTIMEQASQTMTACGTPCWTAPEILRNQKYTERADVYSFGVVLWECATRSDPFSGMPPFQVVFAVGKENLRPPLPKNCPPEFSRLITECWDENPQNRPSMREVLERLEQLEISGYPDIQCNSSPLIKF